LVSDDENDQSVTPRAFELLNFTLRQRLALGRLTVVDATNLNPEDRARLVAIAHEFHVLPAALVFKIDESICHERNALRPDRDFGPQVLKRQFSQLRRGLKHLKKEGFRHVTYLRNPEEIDAVEGIVREPLWNNRAGESGPFDIVGDVHGCYDELRTLLSELGYTVADHVVSHPAGRRLVFVGDLVDRGPDSPNVLRLAMASVKAGSAICVPGNHDAKFLRWLNGKKVQPTHGLAETIAQLEADPLDRRDLTEFLDGLVSHYVFDGGKLVVAHAGLKEEMQGRGSGKVREFCLYGDTTGERDEYGLPERLDWARDYRGKALVVYGHTPFAEARWLIYLPPTMSPCGTSAQEGWLERPEEAFDYFRQQSVNAVVCEEKHMGSRAVAVVCRDPAVAVSRFGLRQERRGVIYTRTGRTFFSDAATEAALLDRLAAALDKAGLWEELATDWLCLDAELMP
jgi:protein phosphatase